MSLPPPAGGTPGLARSSSGGHARFAAPIADINVTPFVDVMLVLLVIFMVTAPMVAAGVDVDLPQNQAPKVASDRKPLEISMDAAGQIYIEETPVAAGDFPETIRELARAYGDPASARVFVRADRTLDYGLVMGAVSQLSSAGFVKVAFLSEPQPARPR